MNLQKQIIVILVGLLLSLSLIGCKQKTVYPNTLLRIDSLIVHHPDSALYMLDLLDDFMLTQPEEIQMYHCLLRTKAKEQRHEPHISDLEMKRVVEYYRKNGPSEKLIESYFLLACIYRDLGSMSYALEYYQKAIEVRADIPFHSLKSRAYRHMGALFTNQGMHFEATDVYRKACYHALFEGDSLELALHYKNLASNFAMRNKMDSTMKYYELAGQYDAKGTVYERVDVYIQQKEFDKARKMLDERGGLYSEWGDYYHGINKRDSAFIYYQHALDGGGVDYLQQLNIYRRLALYAEEQGRIMQALMYTKIVNGLLDSLNVNHKLEAEDRMRALYSHYDARPERDNLVEEEKRDGMDWKTLILLVPLFVWMLYYGRKKYISSLSSNKKLSELMTLPTCRLVKDNARNPHFKLNEAEWKELKQEMDATLNDFSVRLRNLNPKLSDGDLHVCYLLKLELSPTEMAHILVCQTNTVSTIRKRLYKKIYGVDGTPGQLDKFIKNF